MEKLYRRIAALEKRQHEFSHLLTKLRNLLDEYQENFSEQHQMHMHTLTKREKAWLDNRGKHSKEWMQKPSSERTWDAFGDFFGKVDEDFSANWEKENNEKIS